MESRNPVFSKVFPKVDQQERSYGQAGYAMPSGAGSQVGYGATPDDLSTMYDRPAATPTEMGRMTIDDVVMKTGIMFAVLLATAVVGWVFWPLALVDMLGGLVLGLIIGFKQSTNKALILSYAACEGLLVGGISQVFSSAAQGSNVVGQAVLGTLTAFASMLFDYKMGWIKATPKFTKWLLIAGVAYLVLSLASFVASVFFQADAGTGWGFRGTGLGILLCVAGVAIASFFLILDFDSIERGVRDQLPQRYSWLAAFGLVATLVWIYLEFLRLLSILQSND